MKYSKYISQIFEKKEFIDLIINEYRLKLISDKNNNIEFKDRIGNCICFEYVNEGDNKIKVLKFNEIFKTAPCVGISGNIFSQW